MQYIGSKRYAPAAEAESWLLQQILSASLGSKETSEEALALRIGYSVREMRRRSVRLFGEPPYSFVGRLRLERAAGSLAIGNETIAQIATESGFSSAEALAKCFHMQFGCSPTDFRIFNQNTLCSMPGYVLTSGIPRRWVANVKIRVLPKATTTFIYDGPVLLGRFFSSGRIDWTLP